MARRCDPTTAVACFHRWNDLFQKGSNPLVTMGRARSPGSCSQGSGSAPANVCASCHPPGRTPSCCQPCCSSPSASPATCGRAHACTRVQEGWHHTLRTALTRRVKSMQEVPDNLPNQRTHLNMGSLRSSDAAGRLSASLSKQRSTRLHSACTALVNTQHRPNHTLAHAEDCAGAALHISNPKSHFE